MKNGFLRVVAASPDIVLADPRTNAKAAAEAVRRAAKQDARVVVFPELFLTGSTAGDLFFTSTLLCESELALREFLKATQDTPVLAFLGLPVALGGRLYNVAAVSYGGKLLAVIPKSGTARASRHFAPAPAAVTEVALASQRVPFGRDLLLAPKEMPGVVFAAVFGDELCSLASPAATLAAAGATVFACLSAQNELVGSAAARRRRITDFTSLAAASLVLSEAGRGESGTDLVFGAHRAVAECGNIVAEALPFAAGALLFATLDTEKCVASRRRAPAFAQAAPGVTALPFSFPLTVCEAPAVSPSPFVPADAEERKNRAALLLRLQSEALAARMARSHSRSLVIGLSGGLDSTLAILVAARACDLLSIPRTKILAVTMPGFGTTGRTRGNAEKLADALGATLKTVPIGAAVMQHFTDIGHDPSHMDVVYENAQARERTQILMDLANAASGLVVGTGDLSELALGWATYNGDHMSMYGVNADIPKTLVRHLVAFSAEEYRDMGDDECAAVLDDILDTPVSPELLPPKDGEIAQCTEGIVGPYELHDFFLYYAVRYGYSPKKILLLAARAFDGTYPYETIVGWLRVFFRRFLTQQFKRSCLPDGPKVGSVGFSPRGDFSMPSDASIAAFEKELSELL